MSRKIAIKGDRERHEEVLEILELLGGKKFNQIGNCNTGCYFIGEDDIISLWPTLDQTVFKIFSIDEFWKQAPFKVGERVIYDGEELMISGIGWIVDEEKIYYGLTGYGCLVGAEELSPVESDENDVNFSEDYDPVDKAFAPDLRGQDYSGRRYGYKIPNGYEFEKIEKGEIILKPIGPVIPTTFEECCNILGITPSSLFREHHENVPLAYVSKMDNIYKLIICQHAYWKVLCNDFKPGINSEETSTYCSIFINPQLTLIFPYKSVMEQFKENFKDIIEKLKNL